MQIIFIYNKRHLQIFPSHKISVQNFVVQNDITNLFKKTRFKIVIGKNNLFNQNIFHHLHLFHLDIKFSISL